MSRPAPAPPPRPRTEEEALFLLARIVMDAARRQKGRQ
jgi:hypothetical protein